MLISLLVLKITSSSFQKMFIIASSFLSFKYLIFYLYTLKVGPFNQILAKLVSLYETLVHLKCHVEALADRFKLSN